MAVVAAGCWKLQRGRCWIGLQSGCRESTVKAVKEKKVDKKHKSFEVVKLEDLERQLRRQFEVSYKFEALHHANDIEEQWKLFQQAVTGRASVALGKRRGYNKEMWITAETCIYERKQTKLKHDLTD
ncbi:Hypothetical predicted protein [Octopus vulgaris]|uniref:Uncharacterized protein n=1 Tax=Octopus vulgaris TaxID=6645 RepID=A0AA36EVH0_OCTVU|nr:Hypothetical predicted protein [Octopus vulgaris]